MDSTIIKIGKKFLQNFLRQLKIYALYSLYRSNSLRDNGWFLSFKLRESVDARGNPIPWMTYPFIKFIEPKLNKNMKIFEYGCGNSTLWLAKRVALVVSCEHEREWFNKIKKKIPVNVSLIYLNLEHGDNYSKEVSKYKNYFDIIIIDGEERVSCAINSLRALNEKGVIIWDNTDRKEYSKGYDFLYEKGFKRLDFWGTGPINDYQWCTSLFYRTINILNV